MTKKIKKITKKDAEFVIEFVRKLEIYIPKVKTILRYLDENGWARNGKGGSHYGDVYNGEVIPWVEFEKNSNRVNFFADERAERTPSYKKHTIEGVEDLAAKEGVTKEVLLIQLMFLGVLRDDENEVR